MLLCCRYVHSLWTAQKENKKARGISLCCGAEKMNKYGNKALHVTIWNQILCQARRTRYVKITATQATFGLIDPTLIYNRFLCEFDFQWDIKFMTQLNGPAGYTRAQHICRDAPELQIAAHALLPGSTSLFTRVFFAGISTTLAIKTRAGRCVGPQKRSLKNRVASVADAQMEAEGGSRGFFGVFVPSTVCPLRGAGGEEGGGGGTSRLRALADDQCLGFIFAISEGGGGWVRVWLNLSSFTSLKRT